MIWYSHLLRNCPQFVVIYTVKGFGIVNKAEIDVFLELSCFFNDPVDVGNLISGSSAFSKSSLDILNFMAAVTIHSILEPKRVVSHYFHCFLCLLRNLYTDRKQQLELDMEQQTGSK